MMIKCQSRWLLQAPQYAQKHREFLTQGVLYIGPVDHATSV